MKLQMNKRIEEIIFEAVEKIIKNSTSKEKIKKLSKKHNEKIHFIPKNYRVFGGILQSMNIQFGNFIEELMALLIENETDYEILKEYSGKKSNSFLLSKSNDSRIDRYITECQINGEGFCNGGFQKIQDEIILDKDLSRNKFKHDIDLLFKDKKTGKIYYLEIKYNDDHDTGKFVDINRKFIKTYAYLVKELNIDSREKMIPLLFFFNNRRMKGNPYIPEKTNIRRGEQFFKEFLSVSYSKLNGFMENLSESPKNLEIFDKLYLKIKTEKNV